MPIHPGLRPAAFSAYRLTATMAASSLAAEGPLFLTNYLLRIIRVLLLLSIWRTLIDPVVPVGGMTLAAILTYTVLAEALNDLLDVRTELGWTIWNGVVVTRYLQPLGMPGVYLAEALGRWSLGLGLFALPLLALAPLLGVDPRPASPAAALLFLPSLVLAVSVGLAIDFLMGALLVALRESIWMIEQLRAALLALLSGALLPLALLPWSLGDVLQWLPPAAMASSPLRVYTGTGDALLLLTSQLFWALTLWPLALWLWRRSRERLAGLGG